MSSEETETVTGDVSIVSYPIYKLNPQEVKGLEAADFNLKKTNSGNYRITYKGGKWPILPKYKCCVKLLITVQEKIKVYGTIYSE